MTRLIVASRNPVKLGAVEGAYRRLFPERSFEARGVAVPSGVSAQPRSSDETRAGARQRAHNAARAVTDADFWIGIEGGVELSPDSIAVSGGAMSAFAWVVVLGRNGRVGQARSASFFVPPKVAELVAGGMELGEADDLVFERRDSKRREGAVGILTRGVIDRLRLYEEAVVLALIPFRQPDLYPLAPEAAASGLLAQS